MQNHNRFRISLITEYHSIGRTHSWRICNTFSTTKCYNSSILCCCCALRDIADIELIGHGKWLADGHRRETTAALKKGVSLIRREPVRTRRCSIVISYYIKWEILQLFTPHNDLNFEIRGPILTDWSTQIHEQKKPHTF